MEITRNLQYQYMLNISSAMQFLAVLLFLINAINNFKVSAISFTKWHSQFEYLRNVHKIVCMLHQSFKSLFPQVYLIWVQSDQFQGSNHTKDSMVIASMPYDLALLPHNIICYACSGLRCLCPHVLMPFQNSKLQLKPWSVLHKANLWSWVCMCTRAWAPMWLATSGILSLISILSHFILFSTQHQKLIRKATHAYISISNNIAYNIYN